MQDKPNRLDDFFRDSLKDLRVEPAENGWKRFAAAAGKAGLINKKALLRNLAWVFTGALLIILSVLIIPGKKLPVTNPEQLPVSSIRPQLMPVTNSAVTATHSSEIQGIAKPKTVAGAMLAPDRPGVKSNPVYASEKSTHSPEAESLSVSSYTKPGMSLADNNTGTKESVEEAATIIRGTEEANPPLVAPALSQNTITETTKNNAETYLTGNPAAKQKSPLKAGLSIAYHYDQSLLQWGRNVQNIAMELALSGNRLSLTGGIGISVTERGQHVKVLFNEYLGKYNRLDSIAFSWDPNRYHLVPTYFTTETTVYDSSLNTQYYSLRNRYTYLRIPLHMEYRIMKVGKLGVSVKAGAEMDIFLDSQHRAGTYSSGLNKVVYEIQENNGMNRNDLYLLGSLTTDLRINRRLTFALEPMLKYRLTNQQDASNINPLLIPWLRVSAVLNF